MNDAHCHFEMPHYLISDFFYEHMDEYARVRHEIPYDGKRGYYDRCRGYYNHYKGGYMKNIVNIINFLREMDPREGNI